MLLLFLVGNNNVSAQNWELIDRIVQQIIIQTKDGDPDVAPMEIDVKKLVKQYVLYDVVYLSHLLLAVAASWGVCTVWWCAIPVIYYRLANENVVRDIQSKMREVQKENDELNSQIAKKERECEIKTEEKVRVLLGFAVLLQTCAFTIDGCIQQTVGFDQR